MIDAAVEGSEAREEGQPIPVIVFLSGSRRGETLRLGGSPLRIGTDPACEIRLPLDTAPLPLPHHATLRARGETYELVTESDAAVWVNGEPTERLVLASGDVMEIGRDGAVLRFRLYEADAEPYKSLPQVFSDCIECVRAETGVARKAGALATALPRELATRTSRRFRRAMVFALVLLAGATVFLARRSIVLERRLLEEVNRLQATSELLDRARAQRASAAELERIVVELEGGLAARVQALEARTDAAARVIARASRATLFLQGSYYFVQSSTGRPLRMVLGRDGTPLTNVVGQPALSLEGDGPVLEVFVTGTGFVASPEGLVVTNRHVALPWEFDEAAAGILASGLEGRMGRFLGYLPGLAEPFEMSLVAAADDADVAVLLTAGVREDVPYLPLAVTPPSPGEGVVVVGYPLGLRALLARSDAAFVGRLRDEGVLDFWDQARRIADAGYMAPLASRGIVGQVTPASVVYDAETTSGGSGGPVLSLEGEVVAVNAAILPEFGGSNLGVPADAVREILARAQGN